MSMCSRPRKPQRKPKPSAWRHFRLELQGGIVQLQLGQRIPRPSYSCDSTGYSPAKTCGLTFLKPGNARWQAGCPSVTVSPTGAAFSSLMPAMMNPTSPADSLSQRLRLRREHAQLLAVIGRAGAIRRILSLGLSVPSTTRTSITTPT